MKIKNLKLEIENKGFALIYVLLFVVLLLIAVSATWFTGLADLRLAQKSEYSVQAMQLAQAGIDDGWLEYKDLVGNTNNLDQKFPDSSGTTTCNGTTPANNPILRRTVLDANGNASVSNPNPHLKDNVNLALNGVYDYYICGQSIYAIGYYMGSKITLQAIVDHTQDQNWPIGCDNVSVPCTGLDHSNDYITITQTGPS